MNTIKVWIFKFCLRSSIPWHGLYTWNTFFYLEIHQYIYLLFHMAVKFFVTLREEYNMYTIFLSENMERGNFWKLDIHNVSSVSDLSTATVTRSLLHTLASHAIPLLWQLISSVGIRMYWVELKCSRKMWTW
jgi:lysine/ornithine N-monooxygenase